MVVVAAAAISGATFDAAEVAAVVQAPLIEVISVVTRLERAGVVAATEQVHRFRHEHFRRSAEQLVSAPIRAALHRAYVDFFTARGESPLLIVDHVLASGSTGTEPLSEVSVTSTAFEARASSRRMKSPPSPTLAKSGKISSRPWRRGSPIETPERRSEIAVIVLLLCTGLVAPNATSDTALPSPPARLQGSLAFRIIALLDCSCCSTHLLTGCIQYVDEAAKVKRWRNACAKAQPRGHV